MIQSKAIRPVQNLAGVNCLSVVSQADPGILGVREAPVPAGCVWSCAYRRFEDGTWLVLVETAEHGILGRNQPLLAVTRREQKLAEVQMIEPN
jgi:hypothetical protein